MSHHAVIGDDYTTTLMFGVCESRVCILLSILDDSIAENTTSFNITLERTPNLHPKIFLETVHGVVHIEDDDGMSRKVTHYINLSLHLLFHIRKGKLENKRAYRDGFMLSTILALFRWFLAQYHPYIRLHNYYDAPPHTLYCTSVKIIKNEV